MNKPETALPWCISNPDGELDTQVIQMAESNPSAVAIGLHEGDAAYIVRAANAYPKLVAALIQARDELRAARQHDAADRHGYTLRALGEE